MPICELVVEAFLSFTNDILYGFYPTRGICFPLTWVICSHTVEADVHLEGVKHLVHCQCSYISERGEPALFHVGA